MRNMSRKAARNPKDLEEISIEVQGNFSACGCSHVFKEGCFERAPGNRTRGRMKGFPLKVYMGCK